MTAAGAITSTEQDLRDALPESMRGAFDEFLAEREEAHAKRIEKLEDNLRNAEDAEDEKVEALETVRLWMHDVLYDLAPRGDPRRILDKVEEALRC